MKVLVDSCVFIDFFRPEASPHKDTLRQLIADRKAALSPFVKLELLQGVRKKELPILSDLLTALDSIAVSSSLFETAETLLPMIRSKGLNAGLVDFLIAVQGLSEDCAIYTTDKMLVKVAKQIEAPLFRLKS